ncbi:IMPACT family protein [Aestuariispira ectoiniformans]|uniref:IMPACT family protein n=1 Tax=Aestuariispira ectoiniformans TaxID=2775080 RepID=UPI00223B3E7F|nr:YigZ family protein [Aestuariispira ectoiniformans]
MSENRYTIDREFDAETEVKKSRFLAFLIPYEYFEERLAALQKEFRKANHHVTAFRNLDTDDRVVEGCKDDGEPSGTAGMPILKVLQGRGLINCGIVVVRFFGGTKLGTGGLARAYADAAITVIEQASLNIWFREVEAKASIDFASYDRFQRDADAAGLHVIQRDYDEAGVTVTLRGAEEDMKPFLVSYDSVLNRDQR